MEDLEKFAKKIEGKKIINVLIGDDGIDIEFENTIIELYDFCKMIKRLSKITGDTQENPCNEIEKEYHVHLAAKLINKKVIKASTTHNCLLLLLLDNGETVCIPTHYAYAI